MTKFAPPEPLHELLNWRENVTSSVVIVDKFESKNFFCFLLFFSPLSRPFFHWLGGGKQKQIVNQAEPGQTGVNEKYRTAPPNEMCFFMYSRQERF